MGSLDGEVLAARGTRLLITKSSENLEQIGTFPLEILKVVFVAMLYYQLPVIFTYATSLANWLYYALIDQFSVCEVYIYTGKTE